MSTIPGMWTLPFNRALSQAAIVVPKQGTTPQKERVHLIARGPTVPVGPEEGCLRRTHPPNIRRKPRLPVPPQPTPKIDACC